MPLPLSILDLAPVSSGSTSSDALRNSIALAQLGDRLGYTRYWMAEHHNTSRVVSSAPEILLGVIGQHTQRIRIGSGGIMLPNHSPLKVAEWFRTLEALYPGRVDLGLGRAPGTDQLTALALRRSMEALRADDFPEQIDELLTYGGEPGLASEHPFANLRASPRDVPLPPIWLLGSSTYGAHLAAKLGRGYAFAYHFSPEAAQPAMRAYRSYFKPSRYQEKPYAILGVAVICSESEARADELALCNDAMWLEISRGRDGKFWSPEEVRSMYSEAELRAARGARANLVYGTPETVKARLENLAAELQADELMVTTYIHDHAERLRSYELLAQAFGL